MWVSIEVFVKWQAPGHVIPLDQMSSEFIFHPAGSEEGSVLEGDWAVMSISIQIPV